MQAGALNVSNLIAETNQGFVEKSFNSVKIKLPSFLLLIPPPSINHRQSSNPCMSLHANDWETKIKSSSTFSHAYSIIDLVICISTETKKSSANTPCTNNFFFCHGNLTHMSDAVTMIWTKEQDTHTRWMLPEL